MKKILSILAVVAALAGCSCMSGECAPTTYCGTYQGILVSANGTEIDNILYLNPNGTYTQQQYYAHLPDGLFTEQGSYSVNGDRLALRPDNGMMSYYQVGDGKLTLLNTQQMLRPGTYIMKKGG